MTRVLDRATRHIDEVVADLRLEDHIGVVQRDAIKDALEARRAQMPLRARRRKARRKKRRAASR